MAKKTSPDRLPELYKAVMTLESEEECRQFFEDLCSESELTAIEQRYQVAKLLLEDKVYLDILLSVNMLTDYVLLRAAARLAGRVCSKARICAAASVHSAFSSSK